MLICQEKQAHAGMDVQAWSSESNLVFKERGWQNNLVAFEGAKKMCINIWMKPKSHRQQVLCHVNYVLCFLNQIFLILLQSIHQGKWKRF